MKKHHVFSLFLVCILLSGCVPAATNDSGTGKDSAFYNTMAVAFMNEGKYQLASVELHKALQQDPGNADALNNLGLVHMQFEEYETAISYFRQAVNRNAQLSEAYNSIGVCYMKLKNYKEAAVVFRQVLADPLYKTPEIAYYNLGITLYREGNYDEALKVFNGGLRRNPDYITPLYGLALIYNRTNRLSEAAEILHKAIASDSNLQGDSDKFAEALRKRLENATGCEEEDIRDLLDILKY